MSTRKRKRKKVTIEDLAGPCDLNYDTALAEYEVAKRHSLAGDSALPAISARTRDQLAKDFLKRKLAKIPPALKRRTEKKGRE